MSDTRSSEDTTMDDRNLFEELGQVSSGEAAQIFRSHLRGFVLKMICQVMASEKQQRCVAEFLLLSFEMSEGTIEADESLRALRKHWMKYLSEDQQSVLRSKE